VTQKRYDPLWKIVGEKVALQGQEAKAHAACPYCHVTLELPAGSGDGDRVLCGLCGGSSVVVRGAEGVGLQQADR
jgi:Zn finger protein HypA/HybF involved in hydrogenase expression